MESSGKSESSLTPSQVTLLRPIFSRIVDSNTSPNTYAIEAYETSAKLTSCLWRQCWRFIIITFTPLAPTTKQWRRRSIGAITDRLLYLTGDCQQTKNKKACACRYLSIEHRHNISSSLHKIGKRLVSPQPSGRIASSTQSSSDNITNVTSTPDSLSGRSIHDKKHHHFCISRTNQYNILPFYFSLWWIIFLSSLFTFPSCNAHSGSTVDTESSTDKFLDHLTAQTPNYMFHLHERHKRDWLDFDQFESLHLKHPLDRKVEQKHTGLGVVTAIRHHKHIGTYETNNGHLNPWLDAPTNPLNTFHKEHQLLFRLAEMPEHEKLIAASLRLRYEPMSKRPHTHHTIHCGTEGMRHQWPVFMWLHYDEFHVKAAEQGTQVFGSFEPDDPQCELSYTLQNRTLIHFPSGWFNIPLSGEVLRMIQHAGTAYPEEARIIVLSIRSVTSPEHGTQQTLRFASKDTGQWDHESPHLITYHRDDELAGHLKRQRRSVPSHSVAGQIPHILTTEATPEQKSFAGRYRKLQQLLRNDADQADQKRRVKRRSFNARRYNRDTYRQWHPSAPEQSAQRYWYQDSVEGRRRDHPTYYNENPYQYERDADFGHGNAKPDPTNHLENICQRRDLIIDFSVVGWSGWVIAPRKYNARYCFGQCPFPLSTHYNTTNHAVLSQLVHLLDAARVPGPCCVPHQLSPQSLLYHSQKGDVVLRVYQDMVVESCACR